MSNSLNEIAEKTFDSFKKVTPALLAMAIITGMILFLPIDILEKMSLHELPEFWKRIIGVVFILCVALIFSIIFYSIITRLIERYKYKKFRKNQRKKLINLSSQQMGILKALLHSHEKAIRLNKNTGDVVYLLTNVFIYQPEQATSIGADNEMWLVFVPHPWLMDLYQKEPELFK